MSRYLELTVSGTLEAVAARALKAFGSIGRVEAHDPRSHLEGTIRIDGVPASVTVEWMPRGERMHLDITARSDDTLNRAADAAMYRFVDAYKELDWPFSSPRRRQRTLSAKVAVALGVFGLVLAVVAGVLTLSGPR